MTWIPVHTSSLPPLFDPIFPEIDWIEPCYLSNKSAPISQIRRIQDEVCRRHGITHDELVGHRRNAGLVKIRHEAIRLVHASTNSTLMAIGRAFNRDHTTIMYVCDKEK